MNQIFKTSIHTLNELICLLKEMQDNENYSKAVVSLSGATIGQHTRHIIELYQCLLDGYETGIVNYDKRKRDTILETYCYKAIRALDQIKENLEQENKDLQLEFELQDTFLNLSSNYFREVYYNLEHAIHHQALIKVALIELHIADFPDQFGVAPSTLQYRYQCAQ